MFSHIFVYSLEQDTYLIRETSFCQFSNMASSGLKKMFSQQFWTPSKVYGKMVFHNIFNIDVWFMILSYMYQILLCLGWCYCLCIVAFCWVGRRYGQLIIWFMTDVGWCYCHFLVDVNHIIMDIVCGRWKSLAKNWQKLVSLIK